jgi:hypothetical protein
MGVAAAQFDGIGDHDWKIIAFVLAGASGCGGQWTPGGAGENCLSDFLRRRDADEPPLLFLVVGGLFGGRGRDLLLLLVVGLDLFLRVFLLVIFRGFVAHNFILF